MTEQQNFLWLTLFVGAGCMSILCIGLCIGALVVSGIAAFFLSQSSTPPSMLEPVVTVPVETLVPNPAEPTINLSPTIELTFVEPTLPEPMLTGGQRLNEYSLSFGQPGEAAFFVYTFDFLDKNDYKVLFDNVEAWQPIQ